jgi:Arc/MetJ family transcription regulator
LGRTTNSGDRVIFKGVQDGRPYPAHDLLLRDWAAVPPRQVRLDQLVTTKKVLALDVLLDDDSTFYGDLFPHVVQWHDELYLEDGLHRALRAALQQRNTLHVRVLNLDAPTSADIAVAPDGRADTDDSDVGWGESGAQSRDADWYRRETPPHHGD